MTSGTRQRYYGDKCRNCGRAVLVLDAPIFNWCMTYPDVLKDVFTSPWCEPCIEARRCLTIMAKE